MYKIKTHGREIRTGQFLKLLQIKTILLLQEADKALQNTQGYFYTAITLF